MLLSVIVPVYKVEEYLEPCVDSILNQTYRDIEIILVNDGSPDACGEICDRLACKDERIRVIHKENGGLASARNAGIEAAKGTYLTFIDSDDQYGDVNTLEACMARLLSDPSLDIVQFPLEYTSGQGETISPVLKYFDKKYSEPFQLVEEFADWLKNNAANVNGSVCNKVFCSRLFKHYSFNTIYSEDTDFLIRILEQRPKVLVQNEGKYLYFQREGSIIHSHRSLKKLQDIVGLFTLLYTALGKYSSRYEYHSHCLLVIDSTLQEIYRNYGRTGWRESVGTIGSMRPNSINGHVKQKLKLAAMSLLGMRQYSNLTCFVNYTLLKR